MLKDDNQNPLYTTTIYQKDMDGLDGRILAFEMGNWVSVLHWEDFLILSCVVIPHVQNESGAI